MLIAEGGVSLSGTSLTPRRLLRTWINLGEATWADDAPLQLGAGATLSNAPSGVFRVMGQGRLEDNEGKGQWLNAGVLRKEGANTLFFPTTLRNSGTLEIQAGTVEIGRGIEQNGEVRIADGARLSLISGTHLFAASSVTKGAGELKVTGGTTTLDGAVELTGPQLFQGGNIQLNGQRIALTNLVSVSSGQVTFAGTYSFISNLVSIVGGTANFSGSGVIAPASLTLTNLGTLGGDRPIEVSGLTRIGAGTIRGSGPIFARGGLELFTGNLNLSGRTLVNEGAALWTFPSPGGAISIAEGGRSGGFVNAGTFRKTGGTGLANFTAPFHNRGLLRVEAGTLRACLKIPTDPVFTERAGGRGARREDTRQRSLTDEQRSPPALSVKTLWATALLALAFVASILTARCGDARISAPRPGPKSLVAGSIAIFRQALRFQGSFSQTGGQLALAGGNVSSAGSIQLLGGSLTGSGLVGGAISNAATVIVGGAGGSLVVDGNYRQTGDGHLELRLDGLVAPEVYDPLVISNTATLGGTLIVALTNGYYPPSNAVFRVMRHVNRSGSFDRFLYPSNEVGMSLEYGVSNVAVRVTNVRPEIVAVPDQTLEPGQTLRWAVQASDADRPAQALAYTLTQAPSGMLIGADGNLVWSPGPADTGSTALVTVTVTDSGAPNLSASTTFRVTVGGSAAVVAVAIQPGVPAVGQCTLRFRGAASTRYVTQYSRSVLGPWMDLASAVAGADGLWEVVDRQATDSVRFYRVP